MCGAMWYLQYIYSQLSRCSTARGSISGLFLLGPTKVKAHKSFIFTEGSPKVENKGKNMEGISV